MNSGEKPVKSIKPIKDSFGSITGLPVLQTEAKAVRVKVSRGRAS